MNLLTGISPESFSDVAMIAEFVHTFRDLLVPKETLHISIGENVFFNFGYTYAEITCCWFRSICFAHDVNSFEMFQQNFLKELRA